jgi:hypothetical protein
MACSEIWKDKLGLAVAARAYLPKDMICSLVPFVENAIKLGYQSVWKKALDSVGSLFNHKLGWDRRKSEEAFWDDFQSVFLWKKGAS